MWVKVYTVKIPNYVPPVLLLKTGEISLNPAFLFHSERRIKSQIPYFYSVKYHEKVRETQRAVSQSG